MFFMVKFLSSNFSQHSPSISIFKLNGLGSEGIEPPTNSV